MIETVQIADSWLASVLRQDPVLADLVGVRVVGTLSPGPLSGPYAAFGLSSSIDIVGVGGVRISTDNLYIAKAVAQTSSWDDVTTVASRIDYLLHREGESISHGGGSLTCTRERIVQQVEVDAGLQYMHLGGFYRIRASADT